jgi:cell division protein FtsA
MLSTKLKSVGKAAASKALSGSKSKFNQLRLRSGKKPDGSDYLVALDIGTEFVKALIGKVNQEDGSIDIVGVGRRHQALTDMQAGAIADIAGVVENCDAALTEAETQAGLSSRPAVIGIAGELVKGTTTTVKVARSTVDTPIDLSEMERIIRLVQQKAEQRAKSELSWEMGGKEVAIRLVNSALVGIEIDGYPVTNPIGFQGKDVVIQLYTAFAPLIHIGALEKTAEELDLDLIAVAAEPFAVARAVIGDRQNQNLSAILMDVGGGTTDIAVIDDGGVQGTKMFGIGGRAYTHAIERDLGISFDQAETLKLAYGTNQLPPQKRPAVEASLDKTADVWISGIELALGEFPKLDHLPNRMFLCGGGASLDMLLSRLEEDSWFKSLPFTRRPIVNLIRPSQVVGIKDTTGKVNDHTMITAMGLLRVGLDTLQLGSGESRGIREKLDRMLSV